MGIEILQHTDTSAMVGLVVGLFMVKMTNFDINFSLLSDKGFIDSIKLIVNMSNTLIRIETIMFTHIWIHLNFEYSKHNYIVSHLYSIYL